jgi:hypothetical protein
MHRARSYTRTIEESIVFASSRKLLALGAVFDKRLTDNQEYVVEKFDVLDMFEAKSQMQVDAFSFALGIGLFGYGLVLMNMELTDDSPLQTPAALPSLCIFMESALPATCAADANAPTYRMDLPTLFAYVGGVQGLFPICSALIGCIRKMQARAVASPPLARSRRTLCSSRAPAHPLMRVSSRCARWG